MRRKGTLNPEGTHKQDYRGRGHLRWVDAVKLRLLAEFLKTVLGSGGRESRRANCERF